MKLKIIKSPGFYETGYFPPLGMSTIYSYLKQRGFDIIQEDLNILNHQPGDYLLRIKHRKKITVVFSNHDRIIRYLKGAEDRELKNITRRYLRKVKFNDLDVLLISIFDVDFCSSMIAILIAKYFKSQYSNKLVIMGGEGLQRTFIYENFELYNKFGILDYYILGYGEEALYMLLRKIQGADIPFEDIPGLCYRNNGRVVKNKFADQVLTMPNFDGLPLRYYTWNPRGILKKLSKNIFSGNSILILPFQMIYGCPNRCAFCGLSIDSRVYYIQPREAVAALKRLSEQYKTKYFFFMHNSLNITRRFINEFCDEIIKSGLKIFWSDCVSAKSINGPEILVKMRKAGACRLVIGLETASPSLLKFINKGVSPEQVSRVLQWSHEAGIWNSVEIIAGLPQEKEEDIQKTVDFLNDNIGYIDEIWLNKYYLSTGSYMLNYPSNYGITNISEYKDNAPELFMKRRENFRYIFDEIDGLKWEDKKKYIDHSYNIIDEFRMKKKPLFATFDHLNIIFYLYTNLSEKSIIRYYCNRYQFLRYLKNLLSIPSLACRICLHVQTGTLRQALKRVAYKLTQLTCWTGYKKQH